jgi:hypothetical protein
VIGKRPLISVAALIVVAATALIVLAVPNGHVCPGATVPHRANLIGPWGPVWICVGDHTDPLVGHRARTDHREALRLAIGIGGIAMALVIVGLGRRMPDGAHAAPPRAMSASADTTPHKP